MKVYILIFVMSFQVVSAARADTVLDTVVDSMSALCTGGSYLVMREDEVAKVDLEFAKKQAQLELDFTKQTQAIRKQIIEQEIDLVNQQKKVYQDLVDSFDSKYQFFLDLSQLSLHVLKERNLEAENISALNNLNQTNSQVLDLLKSDEDSDQKKVDLNKLCVEQKMIDACLSVHLFESTAKVDAVVTQMVQSSESSQVESLYAESINAVQGFSTQKIKYSARVMNLDNQLASDELLLKGF